MKKFVVSVPLLALFLAVGIGCSTTGQFKLPPDTKLMVTNRTATPDANGKWETSPFFWAETGGAKYRLYNSEGKMIRTGKLKTHFRVVSIFWPPAALIYWPMGFQSGEFDLTKPGDGYMVTDEALPPGAGDTSVMPAKSKVTPADKAPVDSTQPTPKKKKAKK